MQEKGNTDEGAPLLGKGMAEEAALTKEVTGGLN